MIKQDLQQTGRQTEEGTAVLHMVDRHTDSTGLLRNSTSPVETPELARQSDIRMTIRYNDVGLDAHACRRHLPGWIQSR